VISEASEFNGFCPKCFLLPDPRDSPGHQLQGKRYSHNISEFEGRKKVYVNDLYSHNADHLETNSQDLLAFVKQSGQQLHDEYSIRFEAYLDQVLKGAFWKLLADFWVKLDAGHFPPLEERMLILQLQKVYEHQEFEDAIERHDSGAKRLREIENTSTRVEESTLPADEDYCPICQEKYSELNRFGLEEWPCKLKACKHVMGWSCIGEWLFDHDSCPMCRHTILPLPDSECQLDKPRTGNSSDLNWLELLFRISPWRRIVSHGDWEHEWKDEGEEDGDEDYFTQGLDRVEIYLERRQGQNFPVDTY
jgi:hypothetical protein